MEIITTIGWIKLQWYRYLDWKRNLFYRWAYLITHLVDQMLILPTTIRKFIEVKFWYPNVMMVWLGKICMSQRCRNDVHRFGSKNWNSKRDLKISLKAAYILNTEAVFSQGLFHHFFIPFTFFWVSITKTYISSSITIINGF